MSRRQTATQMRAEPLGCAQTHWRIIYAMRLQRNLIRVSVLHHHTALDNYTVIYKQQHTHTRTVYGETGVLKREVFGFQ